MTEESDLPPVTRIGMVSLGLILAAGIYLAANLPGEVPLGPAVALLACSAGLLAVNLILLSRVEGFAWAKFLEVGKWALLAYVVTAGLIGFVLIHNHVKGGTLVVLLLSLAVYAVHVPVLIAFTVARYWRDTDAQPTA